MRVPSPIKSISPSKEGLNYSRTQITPNSFGVNVAEGLGNLGEGIKVFGRVLENNRNSEAELQSQLDLAQFQVRQDEVLDGLNRNSASYSAIDTAYATQFKEQADKMLANAPNEETKAYIYKNLVNIYGNNQLKAQDLERTRNEQSVTFNLQQQYETTRNFLLDNPDQLDNKVNELADAIQAAGGVLSRQKIEEMTRLILQGTYISATKGQIKQDPVGMWQALLTGVPVGGQVSALVNYESGGNPAALNKFGYAGLYQFGVPRLIDLGVYTPGPGEAVKGWSKSVMSRQNPKWTGTLNIPGHPNVKTLQDFLSSPTAQHEVLKLHRQLMDKEIISNGFDAYLGEYVQGTLITREGLYNMLHLGGVGGTRAVLTGQGNPQDANGTSLLDYAKLGLAPGNDSITSAFGGYDQILTPEQKEGLIKYAEAEVDDYFKRIRDVETASSAAVTALQEQNYGNLLAGIALGEVNRTQLIEAVQSGEIDATQFRSALNDYEKAAEASYSDDAATLQRVRIYNGEFSSVNDILRDGIGIVSPEKLKQNIDLHYQLKNDDPLFALPEVSYQLKRLDNLVKPESGQAAIFDFATTQRIANAQDTARRLIKEQGPGAASTIVDQVARQFAPEPPSFNGLPQRNPYFNTQLRATKTELRIQWAVGAEQLDKEYDSGTISESEYRLNMDILNQYYNVIEHLGERGTLPNEPAAKQ